MKCGKVVHHKRSQANAAQKRLKSKGRFLDVYYCVPCKGYHLGGSPAGRVAHMDHVFERIKL